MRLYNEHDTNHPASENYNKLGSEIPKHLITTSYLPPPFTEGFFYLLLCISSTVLSIKALAIVPLGATGGKASGVIHLTSASSL